MAHGQIDGLRREFPAQQIHQPADPGTVGKTKLIFSRIPGEELAKPCFRGIRKRSDFGYLSCTYGLNRHRFGGRHAHQCNALPADKRGYGCDTLGLIVIAGNNH
ncbi:hypothetical protein D3C75_824830 [compost metagenome]